MRYRFIIVVTVCLTNYFWRVSIALLSCIFQNDSNYLPIIDTRCLAFKVNKDLTVKQTHTGLTMKKYYTSRVIMLPYNLKQIKTCLIICFNFNELLQNKEILTDSNAKSKTFNIFTIQIPY